MTQSHRQGCTLHSRLHIVQLQGAPLTDVIDLHVYYENFLADDSKES